MDIKGDFSVNAPVDVCFNYLNNAQNISKVIPGLVEADFLSDTKFESVVNQSVGMFKVKFKGTTELTETVQDKLIRTKTKGADVLTKTRMECDLDLEFASESADSTKISYILAVNLIGKLAVLGEVVVRVKAKELAADCVKAVTEVIMAAAKE